MGLLLLLLALAHGDETREDQLRPCQVDVVGLETSAILGRLTLDQRRCLERWSALDEEAWVYAQVLATDAFARGERARWVRYCTVHSDRAPEDPSPAYKLALHFSREPEGAAQSLHFAERALAHAAAWSTQTTKQVRVRSLHKLRATAAFHLSQAAPEDRELRERAIALATEWRALLQSEARDEQPALRLLDALGAAQPQ